jgi:beta-lactamase class A
VKKPKYWVRSGASRIERFDYQSGVIRKKRRPFFAMFMVVGIGLGTAFASYAGVLPSFNTAVMNHDEQKATHLKANAQKAEDDLTSVALLNAQDPALQKSVTGVLATFPKEQKWSVYVQDISSGRSANVNMDTAYPAASLYKLFLLAPLESKIPATKWESNVGSGQSLDACINAMLRISDNECATVVGSLANWQYADRFNKGTGFYDTKLSARGGPVTTAHEVGNLLVRLQNGNVLSDLARRKVFDALYSQKYADGIPAGCGHCRVANKTGDLDGYVHDAGIVTHGSRSYVLVVMSQGGSLQQIAKLTKTIDQELLP